MELLAVVALAIAAGVVAIALTGRRKLAPLIHPKAKAPQLARAHFQPVVTRVELPEGRPSLGTGSGPDAEFSWPSATPFHAPGRRYRLGYSAGSRIALWDNTTSAITFTREHPTPPDGFVTDGGLVVLHELRSLDLLLTTIRCVQFDGTERWALEFGALCGGTDAGEFGFSRDRRFCFVATARSARPDHSEKVFVIETETGAVVWSGDFDRDPLKFRGAKLVEESSGSVLWTATPGRRSRS